MIYSNNRVDRPSRRWIRTSLILIAIMSVVSAFSSRKGDMEAGLIGMILGAAFAGLAAAVEFAFWWTGRSLKNRSMNQGVQQEVQSSDAEQLFRNFD